MHAQANCVDQDQTAPALADIPPASFGHIIVCLNHIHCNIQFLG